MYTLSVKATLVIYVLFCPVAGTVFICVSNLIGFFSPQSATCHFLNMTLQVFGFFGLFCLQTSTFITLVLVNRFPLFMLSSGQSTVVLILKLKLR